MEPHINQVTFYGCEVTTKDFEVEFHQRYGDPPIKRTVEAPTDWSPNAVQIFASKFMYGKLGEPGCETSVLQTISRVVEGIGLEEEEKRKLAEILVKQRASFNSPVWFNVGAPWNHGGYYFDEDWSVSVECGDKEQRPQTSACFIVPVGDTIEDIMKNAHTEAMLFKYGSGVGASLSQLRSTKEYLTGGGRPSGPVSFFRLFDTVASVIKSGGKTRRAARLNNLRVDHPDILEFVQCKAKSEKVAHALIDAGYDGNFNGEAYSIAPFQNTNIAVSVTDAFMLAVERDSEWNLKTSDGTVTGTMPARTLMSEIAKSAWACGDPSVQFIDTINTMNTCRHVAPINCSNPCGEYLFLDNTACNLASLNLVKYLVRKSGYEYEFDINQFVSDINLIVKAQDKLIDISCYPTAEIAEGSWAYRTIGLGYANLGGLLMTLGIPYDSARGAYMASAITALMNAAAARQSQLLAMSLGTYPRYDHDVTKRVLSNHPVNLGNYGPIASPINKAAEILMAEVRNGLSQGLGLRNAQLTLLAPTGTIAFGMDCDSTGIEPVVSLAYRKDLAGGGSMNVVSKCFRDGLALKGYNDTKIDAIVDGVASGKTLKEAGVHESDVSAFETSYGADMVSPDGHLKMMAAVQPHLSGGISKTIALPNSCTSDTIKDIYMRAWKLGLKSVTVYRDGCKKHQPINATSEKPKELVVDINVPTDVARSLFSIGDARLAKSNDPPPVSAFEGVTPVGFNQKAIEKANAILAGRIPVKQRPVHPTQNESRRIDARLEGHRILGNVGLDQQGRPVELILTVSKFGGTVGGLCQVIGKLVSKALQWGVPLKEVISSLRGGEYRPLGGTGDSDVPMARSLTDYIGRKLQVLYGGPQEAPGAIPNEGASILSEGSREAQGGDPEGPGRGDRVLNGSDNVCSGCGTVKVRTGSCLYCPNCHESDGCS